MLQMFAVEMLDQGFILAAVAAFPKKANGVKVGRGDRRHAR